MSDSDENISDSSDSDSCDEWQDYFSDPEDSVLDDNALPPVIINTVKYKIDQCSICFEDLDTEIGSPDTYK
ncbi:hypothetical protein Avbf_18537 [Armadillidium vulgare]|nr:hypothetical protein Avbf_18537 [Armadillidium vulgare]